MDADHPENGVLIPRRITVLAFFDKSLRFRGLLALAEEDDVVSRLSDSDLAKAARQISDVSAAAYRAPSAA